MEQWITYKLGKIAECSLGKMLDQRKNKGKPQMYLGNIAVRWGSFNINPSQTMLFEDHELTKYKLEINDIVICEGGEPGRCAMWKSKDTIYIQKALHRVRVNRNIADPFYVYYYITYLVKSHLLDSYFTGTTIKHLPREQLLSIDIKMPNLATQKKIGNILETIDSKIDLNRRINDNLEQQAQALFKSWFVDFEPFKNGKFVESEMGMIPEGWKVGKFSELVEIKYGKDHKSLAPGHIPVYGSGGFMRFAEKSIYNKESVLIPRKGSLNNILYVNHPFWTVDTMFYTIMKEDGLAKFVYLFIKPFDLLSMNSGSAVPSMTADILNNIKLVIPPKSVFIEFENLIKPLFIKQGQIKGEIDKISLLRDTMLPRLMSGELKINDLNC